MESHVEQLVEDTIVDVVERLETLEKAWV
jgi:hypothetical protein